MDAMLDAMGEDSFPMQTLGNASDSKGWMASGKQKRQLDAAAFSFVSYRITRS